MINKNSPIANLAILETIRSRSTGFYLDHFLPILAMSLESIDKERLTDEDIQSVLKENFDIHAPLSTARLIANRAKKKKLITQKDNSYFINHESVQKLTIKFKEKSKKAQIAQNELFQDMINFSKDRFQLDLTHEDVQIYFSEYLTGYHLDLIKDIDRGDSTPRASSKVENSDFLISSYISQLIETKSKIFEYLETTVRGYMLASFLTITHTTDGKTKLTEMNIFLDTPLLMGLLGFDGPIREASLVEMLELAQKLKASTNVFQHSYNEWEGVFEAWSGALRSGNTHAMNPATLQLLRAKKMDYAAIDSLVPRLKSKLERLKITIKDKPPNTDPNLVVDEVALKEQLVKSGFNDRGKRLDRDIDSATAIFRLRNGVSRVSLKDAPPIFVTDNTLLCSEFKKFFADYIDEKSIPIVVGDIWLTNLCWMLNPTLFPTLPKKLIVSHCYGTLYQDDGMWQNFLQRCERLRKEEKISEDELLLVRQEKQFMITAKEIALTEGSDYDDQALLSGISATKSKIFREKDEQIRTLANSVGNIENTVKKIFDFISTSISWLIFSAVLGLLIFIIYLAVENNKNLYQYLALAIFGLLAFFVDIKLFRDRLVYRTKINNFLWSKFEQMKNLNK
ncbi:MAG: hypothetical protein KDD61_00605 [Bdellovibrionales bacterium]|nr:hypothetical protein [Bdellovibrionales bacterium]